MDVQVALDENEDPSDEESAPTNLSIEQIYREYGMQVHKVARRMVSNEMDAEDVAQDVLLQVLRKLPTFRGESALPTWLHRVTVNAALAHRRRKAVRDRNLVHGAEHELLEEGQCPRFSRSDRQPPEEELVGRELTQIIQRAIHELPKDYREVFVRSELDGLPNADIGEQLGLSLAAVKSRLHRARQMMKKALAPHVDESLV